MSWSFALLAACPLGGVTGLFAPTALRALPTASLFPLQSLAGTKRSP